MMLAIILILLFVLAEVSGYWMRNNSDNNKVGVVLAYIVIVSARLGELLTVAWGMLMIA